MWFLPGIPSSPGSPGLPAGAGPPKSGLQTKHTSPLSPERHKPYSSVKTTLHFHEVNYISLVKISIFQHIHLFTTLDKSTTVEFSFGNFLISCVLTDSPLRPSFSRKTSQAFLPFDPWRTHKDIWNKKENRQNFLLMSSC